MAMLGSDSTEAQLARTLLQQVRALAEQHLKITYPKHSLAPVQLLGPSPAIMERRAGRFRFQLQFFSSDRQALHKLLYVLTQFLEAQKPNAKLRWHFDIDPMDIL
jgi:primosomal protein N' (replication factor Y)